MQPDYPYGESVTVEFKSAFNVSVIETLVAFANTQGGTVYVGINDKAEIVGTILNKETVVQFVNEIKGKTSPSLVPNVEITTLKGKKVVLLSIPEYPIKPVSVQGRYYKRVNNSNHLLATSEVVDLHLQSLNSSWDAYPDPVHTMDDISLEKVQKTIEEMRRHGHNIVEDPLSFLLKYNLIRGERPSNAAYLLFKRQDCFLSTVELGYFQTDIIIKDSDRSKSDLLTQIREIMSFVQKHINKEIIITGEARNTERWQYPLEAIREIVMNMVIHRDYRSSADSIVKVYPDKIDFFNPGKLPDNITVDDLMNNTYYCLQLRNKLIAAAGIPAPEFREMSGGFNVTVFSNVTEKRDDVTENVSDVTENMGDVIENVIENMDDVTENQDDVTENVTENMDNVIENVGDVIENVTENRSAAILKIMKENPGITTAQLAKILKVTRMTIHRDLDELKSEGRIRRVGSDKGGHWEVVL